MIENDELKLLYKLAFCHSILSLLTKSLQNYWILSLKLKNVFSPLPSIFIIFSYIFHFKITSHFICFRRLITCANNQLLNFQFRVGGKSFDASIRRKKLKKLDFFCLSRYPQWKAFSNQSRQTIGVSGLSDGKTLYCPTHDFANYVRLNATHTYVYTHRGAVIFVYSEHTRDSFQSETQLIAVDPKVSEHEIVFAKWIACPPYNARTIWILYNLRGGTTLLTRPVNPSVKAPPKWRLRQSPTLSLSLFLQAPTL